jgi:hypothetical protein
MINIIQLNECIVEAERFIRRAQQAKGRLLDEGLSHSQSSVSGNEQTAAVRRSSLDLSKSLSKLRKPR